MKIKISSEREVEIETPCYRRFGDSYFKLNEDYDIIQVSNYGFCLGIQKGKGFEGSAFLPGSKEITEAEFNEVFNQVLNNMTEWKEKF